MQEGERPCGPRHACIFPCMLLLLMLMLVRWGWKRRNARLKYTREKEGAMERSKRSTEIMRRKTICRRVGERQRKTTRRSCRGREREREREIKDYDGVEGKRREWNGMEWERRSGVVRRLSNKQLEEQHPQRDPQPYPLYTSVCLSEWVYFRLFHSPSLCMRSTCCFNKPQWLRLTVVRTYTFN